MRQVKMAAVRKITGLAVVLVAALALPAWAQQTASERAALARYRQYAEAPVGHVHYFQIDGFQYLAPGQVAIWFGVNRMYLLTVETPCINLALANAIGLSARGNMLYRNLDFITFARQRCRIVKIVPVDELRMKRAAAQKAAAASAGT